MKKILFVNRCLAFGGIEKSLINLTTSIKNEYEIDLCLLKNVGEYRDDAKFIFNKVFEAHTSLVKFGFAYKKKKYNIFYNLYYFIKRALRRIITGNQKLLNLVLKRVTKISGYDVVICFTQDPICREFVLQKCESNKKFIFLHYDVNLVAPNLLAIDRLEKFDKVVCVSNSLKNSLIQISKNKLKNVDYLYNQCTDVKLTKNKKVFDNRFKMISVSRLTPEKAIPRFLNVLLKLKNDGYSFVWNVVGDGVCRYKIERIIKKLGLTDCVNMIGFQKNPHEYVKDSDLFVLPSYEEANSMVIIESMKIGIPVLSTKTISAEEMIKDYGYVANNSENGIYEKLRFILDNKKDLEIKRNHLTSYHYSNSDIIEKFKNMVEE